MKVSREQHSATVRCAQPGWLRRLWYGARSSAALESGTDARLWARRDREALEAIAAGRGGHYRFPANAERAFQAYARRSSHVARLINSLIGLIAWGMLPLLGPVLLGVPETLQPFVTALALSVMLPVFLVTAVTQLHRPGAEGTELLLILSYLIELVVVEALRMRCLQEGFAVDAGFTVIVPVAALVLPRLSLTRALGIVIAYFLFLIPGATLLPALVGERPTAGWFLEIVLLGIVVIGTLWAKLTARREWAASVLLDLVAHSDPITGLPNRRALSDHYRLLQRVAAATPGKHLLFLALIDLDHFKNVNDRHGHPYGDGVLNEVGLTLASFARRPSDLVARLGGDEFALLLDDCDADNGTRRLQALIAAVRGLGIDNAGSPRGVVTCSAGGVAAEADVLLADVFDAADLCLYAAKHAGRDGLRVDSIVLGAARPAEALAA